MFVILSFFSDTDEEEEGDPPAPSYEEACGICTAGVIFVLPETLEFHLKYLIEKKW